MPSPSLNLPASDRCPEFLPRLPLSPRGNSHIHFMVNTLPWRHIHFLRYPNLNSPGIVICLVQTLLTQLLSRFLPYSRALSHSMTSSLRGHIHEHPNPLFYVNLSTFRIKLEIASKEVHHQQTHLPEKGFFKT